MVARAAAIAVSLWANGAEISLVPAPQDCRPREGVCRVEVARVTDAAHFYDYDLKGACLAAAPIADFWVAGQSKCNCRQVKCNESP